uniref:Zinc finger C2HC domain-containing protein 1C-like n=1 Tax=Salmo trutta TaxID=8032 RepID=A0A673XKY2_SALTR
MAPHPHPDPFLLLDKELIPCTICHRKFAAERLEKHLQVCERMQHSSRKVFDSSKYRAKGTDLEEFMKTNSRSKSPEVRKSNWRQKHEAFIRNLRQAHVPAAGALQPQPPIQDNDDYVTCPHCARRFAPGPAERHIPKCQNIKSRPPPPRQLIISTFFLNKVVALFNKLF